MKVLEKIKKMPMDAFYRICNHLVREMGFHIRNGVYRENTVVIDAYMPVPGNEIRYVIIFVRKDKFTSMDLEEMVDFETLEIRWMIITTGDISQSAKNRIPANMEITLMDGAELEKIMIEVGILKDEQEKGSYLPSLGELDNLIGWAEDFYRNESYDKALEYINNALQIKETSKALRIKAKILIAKGRYDEALGILERLLVNNVKDDDSWFLMGSALEAIGRINEAEEAYGQCVRFNSRNIGCWLNRGNILFSLEKYDESLLCYENTLKIRQNIPDAWNNRGIVLKHKGKFDDAIRSYNAALKYDPKFARAYLNKAILFYDMRRYEEAENSIFEYLKHDVSEEAYILLSNIYLKRKMLGKAEEMAKKALEINPANIEAKKILRYVYGGKTKDVETDVMHGIEDILSLLATEDLEPIKKILMDAQELAINGELEQAKNKLEEAKEEMKKYVDENMLKNAIIEDIIEIGKESSEPVPPEINSMTLEELRATRNKIIKTIKLQKEENKTREKLLASLEKIQNDMETSGFMDNALKDDMLKAKELINNGNFTEAMEILLSVSAKVERDKIRDLRKILVEDTKTLLTDAEVDIPTNIDEMGIEEIRSLRNEAISSFKKGDGGLRNMVSILSGGGIKSEIINDIKELSESIGAIVPDNIENMSLDELREERRKLIAHIKKGEEMDSDRFPVGFAQVLLELGDENKFKEYIDVQEDEYTDNVRGIFAFNKKDYEKALKYFKRAIAINPEFKDAEFNLAYVLYKTGRKDDAKMHLRHIGMEDTYFEKRKI